MKLDFYKSEGKWYVDLPAWEGAYEDLEMVNGADDFLEILSHRLNKSCLSFELWLSEPDIPHGKMSKVAQDQNGATYQVHNCLYYQDCIWLCNVTKFVFDGFHPNTIYFKVITL